MLPARLLLRASASHALKFQRPNPTLKNALPLSLKQNHRSLCSPHPVPQSSPTTSQPSAAAVNPPKQEKSPSTPKSPDSTTEKKENIPDIPSTSWSSLGFEEQDAKDPNKWKKFAWKYAGAVLLFMISYKTLHWYTDRLEADGKRKRKEMEEDREIAQEILKSDSSSAQSFPYLEPLKDIPQLPKTSSELDQLYVYRAELEAKVKQLQSQDRTSESKNQLKETQAELKDLADEIKTLELNSAGS